MKVIIDTNIVASAIFFGGKPRKILKEVFADTKMKAFVTPDILAEYHRTIEKMALKFNANFDDALDLIHRHFHLIEPISTQKFSRDPDDDKFINCGIDIDAKVLVSGDNDLLVLKDSAPIEILNPAEFCNKYL